MRDFVKQWMVLFGLVVISAFLIPSIVHGNWNGTFFILRLLLVTLTISLLNLVVGKLPIELPLINYFARMCVGLVAVYIYGWIWAWYTSSEAWMVIAMVVPVHVIFYLVETAKVERDVDIINKQIQFKKKKRQESQNIFERKE